MWEVTESAWDGAWTGSEIARRLAAGPAGRTCAVAGELQRDLHRCADAWRALFPSPPFDAAFFSTITLANTFCAPWLGPADLRLANRVTLWVFGLDRLIDDVARTRPELDHVLARCRAVLGGAAPPPGDALTGLLADLGAEMARLPAYPWLGPLWRDELDHVLACMAQEWEWKMAHLADPATPLPSLSRYLDNARFGFSVVYLAQWLAVARAQPEPEPAVARLRAAGWAVERVIRLLNDLATYPREARTADLNALKLGATRAQVTRRIADLVEECAGLLEPLRADHPALVLFLERHIEFNTGFYQVTDYQSGEAPPARGEAGS